LRSRVHPLLSLAPSSEYAVTSHLFSARKHQTPPLGLLRLLRDISAQSPLISRVPIPILRSAHSVSHTLDGLLLPALCELVSSRYHVRDSLFRGLSPAASQIDSSSTCTLLSFAPFSYGRVTPPAPDRDVRLQGFNPTAGPLSSTGGLDLPTPRSPLEFSLPRVFLRTPWNHPRSPSTHDPFCRFLV
jgi:hypothetical protein